MNWLTSRSAPLVALAALALTGCDTGTALNVDLPDTTGISTQYLDLPVTSGTVRLAPVQSLKTSHFLIGRLNDNVAGLTEARAYFNVVHGGVNDSLPSKFTAPVLDSVVMVLGFDKVSGSTTTPATFDVYQLLTPLDERLVYDAGTSTPVGAPLGQNLTSRLNRTQVQTITPAVAATPTTAAVPAVTAIVPDPTVRLILQRTTATAGQPAVASSFFTALFQRLQQSSSFSQDQLGTLLKGLAIVPSASHNSSVLSFGQSDVPRIVVYFHSRGATNNVLSHFYPIYFGSLYGSGGTVSANDPRYYTQITNALPAALQALATRSGFVASGDLNNTSYVQEGTGLGTRITFTGLATLADKPGLTINRAELRVPVKPFSNALFVSPARLFAVEVGNANDVLQRVVNFTAVDRVVQADGAPQIATGNPAFSPLTDGTSTQPYYSIPVTTYLQAYLTNKLDSTPAALVLVPNLRSYGSLNLNTLGLDRAAIDAAKITLRVYYSQR